MEMWLLDGISPVAITLFGIEIRWYAICIWLELF